MLPVRAEGAISAMPTLSTFSPARSDELFHCVPKSCGRMCPGLVRSRHEHGNARSIDHGAGDVAHYVMPERPQRLRRTGHNQVVPAFTDIGKNLIDDESMAHA